MRELLKSEFQHLVSDSNTFQFANKFTFVAYFMFTVFTDIFISGAWF